MVRVKRTGEVSEVDRKVMRILRAEEKRIRRSYGSDNTSEDEGGHSYLLTRIGEGIFADPGRDRKSVV